MKQAFESRLNILLSELLNQIGVVSHSEYIGDGRKDLIIYHQGLAIVLEGSYDKQDAENDAKRRIEQLACDVAIAVQYPKTFAQDLTEGEIRDRLKEAKLPVRVIVPEDISGTLLRKLYEKDVIAKPVEGWYDLDVNLLATLIQEIAQFIINEEMVGEAEEEVARIVEMFVSHLSLHRQTETIAINLDRALYKLYGFSIGEPKEIKEAIFAQATLALLLGSVYYESIRYAHGLDSLQSFARNENPQRALEKATHEILKINYEPIFELVDDILKAFPTMTRSFNELLNLAVTIASKRTLLRRDLAGKVYHQVVGDWALKKGLATFFTQVPAAYLLLHLANPTLCRLADFACGSGTLLVAAYSATNSQHRLSLLKSGIDKHPGDIERDFHISFMNSCHAFDVLGYASQITALNLALHSPETPITGSSTTYTMPLGYREEDSSVSLGSLEFARTDMKLDQIFAQVIKRSVGKEEKDAVINLLRLEPFDLIVMNPPFSRTTGRGGRSGGGLFGFMSDKSVRKIVLDDYTALRNDIKAKLNSKARKLLKNTSLEVLITNDELRAYRDIWQAGEGLLFLYLADVKIRLGGKICFILPKGLLSGVSWFLARTLMGANYHIEHVIVSYEPNHYNFSESTSLSECMVIAQRVLEHRSEDETNFIILLKKPSTSMEAIALANRIRTSSGEYVEASRAKAFIMTVKRKELIENIDNWGRFVSLPDVRMVKEIKNVLNGVLRLGNQEGRVPLVRLNEIMSSIGVDAHRFIDTFQMVEPTLTSGTDVPGSVRIIKGGEEAQRLKMRTASNAYAVPIIERGRKIFEEVAARLLVPDRIWVSTAHVISMLSDEKLISNIFYAVRLKNETSNRLKALCLWLNTTWGILTILGSREETRGGFIRLKMSQWRLLPILDIDGIEKNKVSAFASLFDKFADSPLRRIPEQYGSRGRVDRLRLELDTSFLRVLGIQAEDNDLLSLYAQIAQSLVQWVGD
jgi:hypothetical protein